MEIGSKEKIPAMIKAVKAGDTLLQGFGHRVYKNYDPRAKILKKLAYDVFEVTGRNPLIDVAIELERIALEDDYFIKRKLYPNVDFYSGIIYQAMGFPMTMFRCCSRSRAPPDGWRSGPRWCAIRSRRSPARARSFSARGRGIGRRSSGGPRPRCARMPSAKPSDSCKPIQFVNRSGAEIVRLRFSLRPTPSSGCVDTARLRLETWSRGV